jgi:mono/diheme cytochrome c family protein
MRSHRGLVGMALWVAGLILLAGCSSHKDNVRNEEAVRGGEIYILNCAPCHESTGLDLHKQPPKLKGLFKSKTLPSGAPATEAQVRETILKGHGTMPAFEGRLTDQEVADLIQYLRAF